MSLSMPSHIRAAGLADAPIRHEWTSEIEDDVLLTQPVLTQRISAMSYRAALAFTLGSVEWVVWRLSGKLQERGAFDAIEAAWAAIVDWRYLKTFDFPEFEDGLPNNVTGPLTQAFWLMREALVFARDGEPFWQFGASASELALRVVPDPDVLKAWRRMVIQRLAECYPRPADLLGPPVPRQLLEPESRCEPALVHEYLTRFIASLNPVENPYLQSPEEMIANGFPDTPYAL